MKTRKERRQYMKTAKGENDPFMPNTQRLGFGQIFGERTFAEESESSGVRTILRRDIILKNGTWDQSTLTFTPNEPTPVTIYGKREDLPDITDRNVVSIQIPGGSYFLLVMDDDSGIPESNFIVFQIEGIFYDYRFASSFGGFINADGIRATIQNRMEAAGGTMIVKDYGAETAKLFLGTTTADSITYTFDGYFTFDSFRQVYVNDDKTDDEPNVSATWRSYDSLVSRRIADGVSYFDSTQIYWELNAGIAGATFIKISTSAGAFTMVQAGSTKLWTTPLTAGEYSILKAEADANGRIEIDVNHVTE